MNLEAEVSSVFAEDGVLSRSIPHFMPRSGQIEMALAVAKAIELSEQLVVEASTGVGKTFSYLIPALLSGERVLVSTATKALQDQLFGRDLPKLIETLSVAVTTALLKGRASYVCPHRLGLARHELGTVPPRQLQALGKIEQWAVATQTGDLAELPGLDEQSPLIALITSTRENCLGSDCPQFRACFVNQARRQALAADLVVVNHHLFFADVAVRESGVAELLPTVRIAIFDEAHQLNETGVQFLGETLTGGQLLDFCRDMLGAGLQLARGLVDWQAIVGDCERASRDLRLCVGDVYPGSKLRWNGPAPEGVDESSWAAGLAVLASSLGQAQTALATVSEIASDFVRLQARAQELQSRVELFLLPVDANKVRWLDVGQQLRLHQSPLSIANAMQTRLLGAPGGGGKTWIFTSATLGDDAALSWFTQACGLEKARTLKIGSPFDYARQAALYVPLDFPKPSDPTHSQAVASSVAIWCERLGGRTLVLTTSLKALRTIGQALHESFADSDIAVLVQGELPKRVLIERFREFGSSRGGPSGGSSQRGCVMVASSSFWEGIDLPGDALQLVVIDKLPFPTPSDPMVEAKGRALEAAGRSAFSDYFLPEAAVALKQGAGRLIRRETDHGVLVVCDGRIRSMGYGKRLIKALPNMQILQTPAELLERLDQLTRT